jgi:hypothetical protein
LNHPRIPHIPHDEAVFTALNLPAKFFICRAPLR